MPAVEMTDRELSLACFAVYMFVCQANEVAAASASSVYFPGRREQLNAFLADARDSEALLEKLRSARTAGKLMEAPCSP